MLLQTILLVLLVISLLCTVYGITKNILAFIGAAIIITNIILIVIFIVQITK